MASALTDKLSLLVKQISGQARITESNVADMLREAKKGKDRKLLKTL
jgi:signal recognition particle subunit SRP54